MLLNYAVVLSGRLRHILPTANKGSKMCEDSLGYYLIDTSGNYVKDKVKKKQKKQSGGQWLPSPGRFGDPNILIKLLQKGGKMFPAGKKALDIVRSPMERYSVHELVVPQNSLDVISRQHEFEYRLAKNVSQRLKAHKKMISQLNKLKQKNQTEKIVLKWMKLKVGLKVCG